MQPRGRPAVAAADLNARRRADRQGPGPDVAGDHLRRRDVQAPGGKCPADAGRDERGRRDVGTADAGLSRPDRSLRPHRSARADATAQRDHQDEPLRVGGRGRERRRPRRRSRAAQPPRRHPDRAQRQLRHDGHAHYGGLLVLGAEPDHRRLVHGPGPSGRPRDHPRQGEHGRVRDQHIVDVQLRIAPWLGAERVQPLPAHRHQQHLGRLVGRHGGVGRGEHGGARLRHRHRRLDPGAVLL